MNIFLWFTTILLAFSFVACGGKESRYGTGGIKPEGQMLKKIPQTKTSQEEDFAMGELEMLNTTGTDLLRDTSSDEYKQVYGRSTAPLYPVYFSFDSRRIEDSQQRNLNASTRHLEEHPEIAIIVEGNTDNRGTDEYNMALGEFRALAVKKYMVNQGIAEDRIATTSYGFHRPLYQDENEEAWAKNRRADLIVAKQ